MNLSNFAMSDPIKHECGIALVRLLKPLDYYQKKYGTPLYGLNKLYLLMQKQHNRGQDGAGVATVKLDPPTASNYIDRYRNNKPSPLRGLFKKIYGSFKDVPSHKLADAAWAKKRLPFLGEVLLGHLRYGTHGGKKISFCHPILRKSNWINRNLALAGNFNLTNVDELYDHLIKLGQHPVEQSDTVTVLEKIGHFLDFEVQQRYNDYREEGELNKREIIDLVNEELDVLRIIRRSARKFDGGYAIAGMIGHGDAFVMRDPAGIRPAFYYQDEEIVVVASERPAIQTAMNVHFDSVKELTPGHALIIKKNGKVTCDSFLEALPQRSCSFERIYFSRGTDKEIYYERKKLGALLADAILKSVNYDFDNTVFSFVPNTAEVAFIGMMKGIEDKLNAIKKEKILALGKDFNPSELDKILSIRARFEKIAVKDAKLRTFITEGASRSELVSHVYDVTYGIVNNHVDTLVLVDDSIVRGTTLEKSIIKIVARLKPKKIVVVSSAPQIRYPDCYGIDMSKMKDFVAFRALIALLKETGQEDKIQKAYKICKKQAKLPPEEIENQVTPLYDLFSYEQISKKIAEIVTPEGIEPEVEVIYQTLDGLHSACPNHKGDWYFSGNYPTKGGNKVVNRAFMHYVEGKNVRAY